MILGEFKMHTTLRRSKSDSWQRILLGYRGEDMLDERLSDRIFYYVDKGDHLFLVRLAGDFVDEPSKVVRSRRGSERSRRPFNMIRRTGPYGLFVIDSSEDDTEHLVRSISEVVGERVDSYPGVKPLVSVVNAFDRLVGNAETSNSASYRNVVLLRATRIADQVLDTGVAQYLE